MQLICEQEAIRTAVRATRAESALVLTETPSPRTAFLESFPSLNPFSAARLAALPVSLQELLCSNPQRQEELTQMLPELPEHSLRLFFWQAAWGTPVLQGASACFLMGLNALNACGTL